MLNYCTTQVMRKLFLIKNNAFKDKTVVRSLFYYRACSVRVKRTTNAIEGKKF